MSDNPTTTPEPDDAKKVTAAYYLNLLAQMLLDNHGAPDVIDAGADFAADAARLLDVAAWIDSTRHPAMRGIGLEEFAHG